MGLHGLLQGQLYLTFTLFILLVHIEYKASFSTIKDRVRSPLGLVKKAASHEDVFGSGGTAPPYLISQLGGGEQPGHLHAFVAFAPEK
jgi:hypothetical protein